jgi:hypothetical protein
MTTLRTTAPAILVWLGALLLFGTGCSDGLRRAAVSGQILVDKEPLQEGKIDFFPSEPNAGPSTGAVVKDGKYSIPAGEGAIVGKNRVEIRGFRKSGRKTPDVWEKGKMIDEMISAVPAEFNDKTTLAREIQEGNNTLNFDLPGIKK